MSDDEKRNNVGLTNIEEGRLKVTEWFNEGPGGVVVVLVIAAMIIWFVLSAVGVV